MSKRQLIRFLPQGKEVEIGAAETLLEVALSGSVELNHSCGGMASCGTCRVIIEVSSGPLPPRNQWEAELAEARGFRAEERLACQIKPSPCWVVQIPEPKKVNSSKKGW